MKFEFLILSATVFIIYNTYHDNYYSKNFSFNHKYFKMTSYGFIGLSLYIFFKRKPTNKQSMVSLLTDVVKFMPIDKNASNMFFDISTMGMKPNNDISLQSNNLIPQHQRMMNSGAVPHNIVGGGRATKRSVSETKKKFVASKQQWNKCGMMLDATFEIDHIVDLQYGGSNEVSNLVALCRNCHGSKTMQKFL